MYRCRQARSVYTDRVIERKQEERIFKEKTEAITKIQRVHRGRCTRSENVKRKKAAVHIQKIARSRDAKKQVKKKQVQAKKLARLTGESSHHTKMNTPDTFQQQNPRASQSRGFFRQRRISTNRRSPSPSPKT